MRRKLCCDEIWKDLLQYCAIFKEKKGREIACDPQSYESPQNRRNGLVSI
tara:strand:+ start:393 stop:542 length:150 start_codon:yes stop_codon:yes gene_type:complete